MDVIDLSVPKVPQISRYSPQSHYITMPNLPMYSLPNINFNISQPTLSQHSFYQQLHYVHTPTTTITPNTTIPPAASLGNFNDSISTNISTDVPPPTTSVSSDKDSGSSTKCSLKIPVKRPFKAVSSFVPGMLPLVPTIDPTSESDYEEYRKQILARISHEDTNGTNKNMRRNVPLNPEKSRDPEYLEKRRKNNEAAKKSREARKAKEDELAIRVAFLEKENLKMKFQLAAIERQKKMILMRRRQS